MLAIGGVPRQTPARLARVEAHGAWPPFLMSGPVVAAHVCSNIFMRNMLTSDTLYANNQQMPRDLVFPSSQVPLCARDDCRALTMPRGACCSQGCGARVFCCSQGGRRAPLLARVEHACSAPRTGAWREHASARASL